ncbi:hypothetical protein BACCAP_04096 [Pseudoflavonifractor capillosus ATCC 29799]|uniref:Uncharacterized protein n=1 Tax=Pseudoflavonifractor capillosus ATCC 29799 TaxID=411467 RepID=A6P0T0_9FIRM|nr:hypothetical protein BACCAP_04096 [Pseudoflavonifractor capillosus ATCC 29799]
MSFSRFFFIEAKKAHKHIPQRICSCAHTYDFNSSSPKLKRRIFPTRLAFGMTHELLAVHITSSIPLKFQLHLGI